jgi:hypothetical protein
MSTLITQANALSLAIKARRRDIQLQLDNTATEEQRLHASIEAEQAEFGYRLTLLK